MKPFARCPACNGEVSEKQVEKILRGGQHTAILTVSAAVCMHCGERLYTPETIKQFEQIRRKLEAGEVSAFQPLGQSFRVA